MNWFTFSFRLHIHGKEITRSKRKRKHGAENSSKSVQSRVLAKELRLSRSQTEKLKSQEHVASSPTVPHKRKRFCCKYCDKSYTQAHNLKSHVQKIHKWYEIIANDKKFMHYILCLMNEIFQKIITIKKWSEPDIIRQKLQKKYQSLNFSYLVIL